MTVPHVRRHRRVGKTQTTLLLRVSEIYPKEVMRGALYRKGAELLESYIVQMLELSKGCRGVTTRAAPLPHRMGIQ